MQGYVISGGQDKLIYSHKPGDTQPSRVLVGHEGNVLASRTSLTIGLRIGRGRGWNNYLRKLGQVFFLRGKAYIVLRVCGRIGNVFTLLKVTNEQFGQSLLLLTTSISLVNLSSQKLMNSVRGQNDQVLERE